MKRTIGITKAGTAVALTFLLGCHTGEDLAPGSEPAPPCDASPGDLDGCLGPSASEADAEAVAAQIPGRDLSRDPPKVLGMRVFPLAASSNRFARLEVEIGEDLPRVLNFVWNDRINTLRDDQTNGDRAAGDHVYSAYVDVAFAQEIGLVDAASLSASNSATAADDGIGISVQDGKVAAPDGAALLAADDPDQCSGASCVDPEKAFVIRRTSVVNSNRTSDPCLTSRTDGTRRAWNFGYLLSKLSSNPSELAKGWLTSWVGPASVNGFTVRAPTRDRDGVPRSVPGDLLQEWQAQSQSSTLAMSKAPFRLLAIVNRFDLRTNIFFGPNYAGELRFVFTPLSFSVARESDGSCAVFSVPGFPEGGGQDPNTVILEYRVSLSSQTAVRSWATQWRDLGRMPWSTPDQIASYLTKLEGITESIVTKGAAALHRVRTNEATTSFGPWHLREFEIRSGRLVPATVKQTPDVASLNHSKVLTTFIHQNYDAILRKDYIDGRANMPDRFPDNLFSFLGAEAINVTASGADDGTGASPIWQPFDGTLDYSNPRDIEVRHLFALGTCNGCHGHETGFAGTDRFAHIMPRKRANRAELSNFLTGVPIGEPLNSPNKVTVPDPMAPGTVRHFNQLVLRNQRMADYLDGRTAALAFQPSVQTH